ncbi:Hypothetical protein EIN_206230, partial [Entamoeba invadens IP1]
MVKLEPFYLMKVALNFGTYDVLYQFICVSKA